MLFKLIGFCALVAVCSAERVTIMDFIYLLKQLIHFINKTYFSAAVESCDSFSHLVRVYVYLRVLRHLISVV